MTGISPWFRFKLEPGEVCEVGSHGIVIGKAGIPEGGYGVEFPAKPGDELTCHRGVNIDWGTGSKDGSGGDGIPHYLTTGNVKFKVTAPDPNAAPKVRTARSTGGYKLADGISLQVSQRTRGGKNGKPDRLHNEARIWRSKTTAETVGAETPVLPIELTPGADIDPIIWIFGGDALWIVQEKAIRKIDFSDVAGVKEQNWNWDAAGDFGGAPPEVRAEIEKLRPKTAQVSPPSAVLQFRLVAGREEPDTEPVEPAENWSDLSTFHLRKTAILTAADVKSATAELDKASGRWQIKLVFSEEGGATLAKVTKENLGRQLAIVGNGKVISAPMIRGEIGEQVTLTGNYLESEAKELVEAIQGCLSRGSGCRLQNQNCERNRQV